MAYVYRHIRLDKDEPFYIGVGCDSYYSRARDRTNRNKIWNSIAEKTDYQVDIMVDNVSPEIARQKEIEFINLYGRIITKNGPLANITEGGDGLRGVKARLGKGHNYLTRMKISNSHKGKKRSSETLLKMSIARKGIKNELLGKQLEKRFQCTSPEGTVLLFDSILDAVPIIKATRKAIAKRVNGFSNTPIKGFHSFKLKPKTIMETLPKKFFKMTSEQQEVYLVEYLAKLHAQEDYYKRELAKVRGGYQYEVSTEIDRPDLLTMKQGEGI